MPYKLVCTQEFHGFKKGQEVTNPADVAEHMVKRHHNFVPVWVDDKPEPQVAPKPQVEKDRASA